MVQQRIGTNSLADDSIGDITKLNAGNQNALCLAKIRHGLRTPVNHIIGYAEIIREETADILPPSFVTDLDKIHSSGYLLMTLINRHFSEDYVVDTKYDLRSVCHELRTPVNHIIGYSQILIDQCDDIGQPDLKYYLGNIISAAHTWLALMEEHLANFYRQVTEKPVTHPGSGMVPPDLHHDSGLSLIQDIRPQIPSLGHLLVVDDDEANRNLLTRRLEKLGYRITACGDGEEALEIIREKAPDLVLLDMLMPAMGGHEVLVRIKSNESLRHLPVIMISALDDVEDIAHCIELGAEDYLTKPFNLVLLRSRIGAALEKKRLRDAEQISLRKIEEERARSDRLLLNILPQPIANQLKNGERLIVNNYDEVTVMFADLVGFTSFSAQVTPQALVSYLNKIFSAFDELADQHGLEKIKTIGDAYMAAAGIPVPHSDHAAATARMAMDMHKTINNLSRQVQVTLELRIGICSGPVIAGVIGQNKFAYDLWGDTVNTASRMESHGMPGRTQVAETTYKLLHDRFQFAERGAIEVKGKGPMKTYFLCQDSIIG